MDRNEFLRIFKDNGSEHIRRMFVELAKSNGLKWDDIDNVEFYMNVKDKSKIPWKSQSHFTKMYHKIIQRLVKDKVLGVEELGFVTLLATYLDYEDNTLKNKDGKYLSQQDMMKITGYSKRKISGLVNNLKNNEILQDEPLSEDKRRRKYSLDPNLFFKGKEIDVELKKIYNNK